MLYNFMSASTPEVGILMDESQGGLMYGSFNLKDPSDNGSRSERNRLLSSKDSMMTVATSIDDAYKHDYSNRYLIANLFSRKQSELKARLYPKTVPIKAPVRRGKRHRALNFRRLNNFRHWWKTARLLVRLAGAICFAFVFCDWTKTLSKLALNKPKGMKAAVKTMKAIGRGGMNRPFLKGVQPFTRTMRIYMAINRGFEASVDDRFWEVLIAEAFAFMGNRSLRWWARHVVDWTCNLCIFPLAMIVTGDKYNGFMWKTIVIEMGLVRSVLPFMSSFIGSRIGRQTTFTAINRMNFRWKTVQEVQDFVVYAGAYRRTDDDKVCLKYARDVAATIGHGSNPLSVRRRLNDIGFEIIGTGYGGHSLYRANQFEEHGSILLLHITPHGPSICNEMPRYIVLERKRVEDITSYHSKGFCTSARMTVDAVVTGFSYSGAFFTFQEWAALQFRHDREKLNYDTGCQLMGYKSDSIFAVSHFTPPTDLVSLKGFIRTGRAPKKRKKDNWGMTRVTKQIDHLSQKLIAMERRGVAPRGVIVYFEGLDCAGKSSTGGLIMKALKKAGYAISQVQYNKPPTEEEQSQPWMLRFKQPATSIEGKPHKSALIWDRGPAGDFVYGGLNASSPDLKERRYIDFHSFEEDCLSNGILFCKLLFVTSRDAISKTLGKRLAHKYIVRDLHTWLDANSIYHERDGLYEIEHHIDPSDFVALNKYDNNLKVFHDFVLHTDHVGRLHSDTHKAQKCEYLPWLVINTSARHLARMQIMKSFEIQLNQYARSVKRRAGVPEVLFPGSLSAMREDEEFEHLLIDKRKSFEHACVENTGKLAVAVKESAFYLFFMFIIAGSYLHQTWKIGFWSEDPGE